METLTTEKKNSAVPVVPSLLLPFIPELPNIPPVINEFHGPTLISQDSTEERRWSQRSETGKHREKDYAIDWESSSYNSQSRSSSKFDDDYTRTSSKYYDKYDNRKDRDREYGAKYGHQSSHRGDDYERDRHKRDKNDNRKERDREYGSKYGYHSSRGDDYDRDRQKKDKDSGRYQYSSSKSYKADSSAEAAAYSSSGYGYNQSYGQSSSSSWAPPPPNNLPNESPPRPPPEPSNDEENEEISKEDLMRGKQKSGDDDETTVDLDTRIAMLFKSKSFGNDVPSLFQLNEESDSEIKQGDSGMSEKKANKISIDQSLKSQTKSTLDVDGSSDSSLKLNEIKLEKLNIHDETEKIEDGEIPDMKISPAHSGGSSICSPPSPFHSRTTFISNRKFYKTRKLRRQAGKVKVESGASDISSSEDELLAKGSYSPPLPVSKLKDDDQMSLSSLSSSEPMKEEIEIKLERKDFELTSSTYPVAFSSYDAAYHYQNSFHQFQQPNQWMASSASYDASAYFNQYKKIKPELTTDDPHEVATKKVIDKLIMELKQILKKDFNKRMIENTAFKKYEAWWDDQERNKNTRSYHDTKETVKIIPSVQPSVLPLLKSYQQNGGLGILRNIRFQRIKREPAPIPLEEDSRKSDPDDDDMVHGSDSDKDDSPQTSRTSYISRKITATSSSESSESSDSSR